MGKNLGKNFEKKILVNKNWKKIWKTKIEKNFGKKVLKKNVGQKSWNEKFRKKGKKCWKKNVWQKLGKILVNKNWKKFWNKSFEKKGCQSIFPYCFLTHFTKLFLSGSIFKLREYIELEILYHDKKN